MAFLERKDMPRSMLGIPGLNLWNILVANTVWAWLSCRRNQGLTWDFPIALKRAFLAYVFVIIWSFSRFFIDPTDYYDEGRFSIIIGYLINPLKFLLPSLIIYDGCRDRKQMTFGLAAILLTYFILGILTIKCMGLSNFSGEELKDRAVRVIERDTGYHRVDMSMILAGASWGIVAASVLAPTFRIRAALWGSAGIVFIGQALTGGRGGYVTWILLGITLSLLRWRKLILIAPIALLMIPIVAPGVRDRMLEGFAKQENNVVTDTNMNEVTAGRNRAWTVATEKIMLSPVLGYGRNAMTRTGASSYLFSEFREVFGHPHNAFLELLLDNGILGLLLVLPLFFKIVTRCASLFRDRDDLLVQAVGGAALSLALALVFAGLSALSLYPRESVVGMWAIIGLAMRAWVEREAIGGRGRIMESEDEPERASNVSQLQPVAVEV